MGMKFYITRQWSIDRVNNSRIGIYRFRWGTIIRLGPIGLVIR